MCRTKFILIGCMLSGSVLAATVSDNNHYFVGLSVGPTWITGTDTQTLRLQPDVVKTYTSNNPSFTFPTAELFLGWQTAWCATPTIPVVSQLGISFVGAGNAKLNGAIWEDADPAFDNYRYKYEVNHSHIALKGRLIRDGSDLLEPYVSASVGVGFNHAYNFKIRPRIFQEIPAPPFRSNTTTTFSYTLGTGFQTTFTPQLQAAIGYEFADWGKSRLSRAPGQTINQGLTINHLYANQLQLSLFYIV